MILVFFSRADVEILAGQLDHLGVDLHGVDLHVRVVVLVEMDHRPAAQADDQHPLLLRHEEVAGEHQPAVTA